MYNLDPVQYRFYLCILINILISLSLVGTFYIYSKKVICNCLRSTTRSVLNNVYRHSILLDTYYPSISDIVLIRRR